MWLSACASSNLVPRIMVVRFMRTTHSPNEYLNALIKELRKASHQAPLWTTIASELSKPTSQRRVVNISRLNRVCKDNEIVIVPGKVLGSGMLAHKLTIAAWNFSTTAREQIIKQNGKAMSIPELLKENPKATGVRIIG